MASSSSSDTISSSSSDELVSVVLQGTLQVLAALNETLNELVEDEAESSRPKSRRHIQRDREADNARLVIDYFAENVAFQGYYFRRRFRMHKPLYVRIVEDLTQHCHYFQQHEDVRSTLGFTPLQKCTAALRQLAYGIPTDALDESFRMSTRTARESLHYFCKSVIRVYDPKYLRAPTHNDIVRLQAHHANVHGFPGMVGSLDCLHWAWANCPTAYHGQYTRGDHGYPTIILEAVASQDLWFCHVFFGSPGAINDINVLNRSPIFNKIYDGTAPGSSFVVQGTPYKYGYYLDNGIYSEYAVFVKSFSHPHDYKRKKKLEAQEKARKDVERAFGALKKRWKIIKIASQFLEEKKMSEVMYTCIILHNMMIEDEGRAICVYDNDKIIPETQPLQIGGDEYTDRRAEVRHRETHHNLRSNLVDHIYGIQNIDLNMPPLDNEDD